VTWRWKPHTPEVIGIKVRELAEVEFWHKHKLPISPSLPRQDVAKLLRGAVNTVHADDDACLANAGARGRIENTDCPLNRSLAIKEQKGSESIMQLQVTQRYIPFLRRPA